MDNIKFSSVLELERFYDNPRHKYLGTGTEGTCYRVGNKSYKFYNDFYCYYYCDEENMMKLLEFRNIVIDNIYFIRSLIYFNDELIGTVSDYAAGINCGRALLYRRNIDKLISALAILKKNIYELSKLGICIEDNFLPNVIYDNNSFKLIDTGSYYYSTDMFLNSGNDYDVDAIYKKNMVNIVKMLFSSITNVDSLRDKFIFSFLSYIDSPYKDYLVDSDLMMNPDDTIIGIRDTIQEAIGREITAFCQCRNDLLKIRKKR